MKIKIKLVSVILIALLSQVALAQYGAMKRADYYFGQFAYTKAIPEYEKMVEGDFNSQYAHQRLAECHLLLRDYKQAIPHFEKIIHSSTVPTDYYFKYAMALHSVGKDKEAEEWFKKYKKFNKNDSRVKRFLKDGNLASVVFNSRERYTLEPVHFNTSESEFGAYVKDGHIYYASSRRDLVDGDTYEWNDEPWLDIFMVTEDESSAIPIPVSGDVNSKFHESSLIYTTDYKKDTVIYFTRNNFFKNKKEYGDNKYLNLKIFRAQQNDNGEWIVNKSLPINHANYSTGHPWISPDGRRLYYTSDRPGGYGGTDIYYSEIHVRGRIGKPINAGPIVNTEGDEMFPYVNKEGQLFFSSDGHVGYGLLDIFSTVLDENGEITDVINLGKPINSERDDFGFYAHEDGTTGYVSSNREGGQGSDDIYKFQFTPELALEGYVTDGVNNMPLDKVAITLRDQNSNELVGEAETDENGYYRMFINRNRNYVIEASRKTHPKKNVYFNSYSLPLTTKTMRQDVVLDPILNVKVLADLNKIYFDFDKSYIRPDAAAELDKVVKLMTVTYPDMIIQLESHTDPIGSHAYNDRLSQARAKSTYDYLIENGVGLHQIVSYKGFGERMLVNDCTGWDDCTDEELELNRRTEFPILQIQKGKKILAKR